MNFKILEISADVFLNDYEKLVKPVLDNHDYSNFEEIKNLRNFVVYHNDKMIAWSGMSTKPVYIPNSVHLYGMVVDPNYRKNGLGTALVQHRLNIYPNKNYSVSIQPGKNLKVLLKN